MIINTFSYLWKSTAVEAMTELTRHGFKVFEVPVSSPHCWPDEMPAGLRSDAKKQLQDHGASVKSLNAGGYDINLASPAANMRRKSTDHIKDVIDLAVDWGVTDVVISPGTRRPMISPTIAQALGWLYESLDVLLPVAKQAGVRLLMENTPYCFRPTIDELVSVVEEIKSDGLSIVYDVANAAYIGEDPVAALRAHYANIGLVHISDTGTDVWGHDPIGTGIVDFEGLGRAVDSVFSLDRVVLEIIREEEPLLEINKGLQELKKRGWRID
ncbi:xylose isomerase domain-containing protein (plasmid) [Rhizobium sp. NXC14]|uniref:sugar phosphate isomerase/epimerase family protein n=1 Tax=Rhizobium sp. NXC14 TaxID=1981173 RepID=UPI000A2095ED|nr:sugar phosphate isomerase/epimerase family protein [Rhizobium sp. NXC14]ARO34270.1 xylose isomerase domain-containing protein [Rhizobium sp. NXC14]